MTITQEQKLQLLNEINAVVKKVVEEWQVGQGDTPLISVTRQELKDVHQLVDESYDASTDAESQADTAGDYIKSAEEYASKAASGASHAMSELNALMSRFDD